jgi:hypothetical protein
MEKEENSVIKLELSVTVVGITNTMHKFAPLLYSTYWLLHVSAVACHFQ